MAITVGNTSSSGDPGTVNTSYSWSHTCAVDTNLLVVAARAQETTDADRVISGITYDGNALTKARGYQNDTLDKGAEIWYRANPTTGSSLTIEITHTGKTTDPSAGAIDLKGVDTDDIVEAWYEEYSGTGNLNLSVATGDAIVGSAIHDQANLADVSTINGTQIEEVDMGSFCGQSGYDLADLAITFKDVDIVNVLGLIVSFNAAGVGFTISVFDSVTVTDAVSIEIPVLEINVYDSVTVTDAVDIALDLYEISTFDSISVTDAAIVEIAVLDINVFDSITVTDATDVLIPFAGPIAVFDSIQVTDAINIEIPVLEISVFDSIGVTDAATVEIAGALSINVNDSISVTDAVDVQIAVLEISVFDSVGVTDATSVAVTGGAVAINVYDSIQVTDAVDIEIPVLEINVFDSFSVTDAAELEPTFEPTLEINVFDSIEVEDAENVWIPGTAYSIDVHEHITVTDKEWVWIPQGSWSEVGTVTWTAGAGYRFQRKLARTSNGHFHVVYVRAGKLYYKQSTDNGQTWSSETRLDDDSGCAYPTIAVDSSDNLHVAWVGNSGILNEDQLLYRKFTGSWQAVENLTSDSNYQQGWGPAIAIDNNDYVHIVWAGRDSVIAPTYQQIRHIRYTTSWQTIEQVTSGSYNQYYPCIAADSNGDIHAAWWGTHAGSTSYNQVRYAKYSSGSWGSIDNLTSGSYTSWDPCLAIDSNDYIHCVYTSFEETVGNIKYQLNNGTWQGEVDLTTGGTYDHIEAGISIDLSDNLHVAWEGEDADSPDLKQVLYRLNDGSWQAVENLTNHADEQTVPNMIWAYWPSNNSNRAFAGYAFLWAGGIGGTVEAYYYASSDLGWSVNAISVYDTIGVIDAATVAIAGAAILNINVFDSIGVTDAVSLEFDHFEILVFDSIALSDAADLEIPILEVSVFDSIAVTDAVDVEFNIYEVAVFDSIGVTDAVSVSIPGTGNLDISVYDMITITDAVAIEFPFYEIDVSDSIALSDAAEVAFNLYEIAVFDSIAVTDYAAWTRLPAWTDVVQNNEATWSDVSQNNSATWTDVVQNNEAAWGDVSQNNSATWTDVAQNNSCEWSNV